MSVKEAPEEELPLPPPRMPERPEAPEEVTLPIRSVKASSVVVAVPRRTFMADFFVSLSALR